MILVGSQRGGASNLAAHLLKDENEHVEVHEIRGFASENLKGALNEAYAMSRGTRAKQFLFSLSLNPPPEERVETGVFEDAIARAEDKLGLSGHARIQEQSQGEAYQALMRDRQEKDALIFRQLEQRNALQRSRAHNLNEFIQQRRDLRSDIKQYKAMEPESREDRRAAYIREQQTQQAHDIPRNRGPGLTRDR
ncbi:MAG: hypothetical protein AAF936_15540 [Pseudomonadota bacterium]